MQPFTGAILTLTVASVLYRLGVKARDEWKWRKDCHRCALVRQARIAGRI